MMADQGIGVGESQAMKRTSLMIAMCEMWEPEDIVGIIDVAIKTAVRTGDEPEDIIIGAIRAVQAEERE